MPKLFVVLILTAVVTVASLVMANASMSQYLTALISLAALTVSIVSAFKEDVFPFKLRGLIDEVLLAPIQSLSSGPTGDSPAIILPIIFLNSGYGSGIIEGLTLKIEGEKTIKIYIPITEVDYQKFMSGKRALHPDNIIESFNPFPMESRKTLKKHIVFIQKTDSSRYPFNVWKPGKFTFRLFIKHSGVKTPTEVKSVTNIISEATLINYTNGSGMSMMSERELDV
jgi:hypothetical protein